MINRLFLKPIVLVAFILCTNPMFAQATIDYIFSQGKCGFVAIGKPGFLKINGEGGKVAGKVILEGTNKIVSGEAHVALQDFKTGLETRDEHMHNKYLESTKYPEAIFKFENVTFKDGKIPNDMTVTGNLSLHGVTKPVDASLKFTLKDKEILVSASFTLTLTDFGIAIPSFMSITVAKDVEVNVEFTAIPQST